MVNVEINKSYDEIYMELWEMAQRYCDFVKFRVIGISHDERMIPMIEIGKGNKALFCVSGINGSEKLCADFLLRIIREYCEVYEKNWEIDHLYHVKNLLDKVKLCVIPILNPDGYEIYQKGYLSIRNPVLRQMLRMQDIPHKEYEGNGRNTKLCEDFPLIEDYLEHTENVYNNSFILENETRALIKIFEEYEHAGFIYFSKSFGKIIRYEPQMQLSFRGKNRRITGHLRRLLGYRMESEKTANLSHQQLKKAKGDCGQYYARFMKKTAFRIDIPVEYEMEDENTEKMKPCYETLRTIPLEFIFSI